MSNLIEMLEYAHDIRCSVCGMKATYRITATGYETTSCNHNNMRDLIAQRERDYNNLFGNKR